MYLDKERSERLCQIVTNVLMEANLRECDLATQAAPWINRSTLNRLLKSRRL